MSDGVSRETKGERYVIVQDMLGACTQVALDEVRNGWIKDKAGDREKCKILAWVVRCILGKNEEGEADDEGVLSR